MIKGPKTRFLKVRCKGCNNEQIIFNRPATRVECLVCGSLIAEPTGGLGSIRTKILEVLE